jgi:hypothetical protein
MGSVVDAQDQMVDDLPRWGPRLVGAAPARAALDDPWMVTVPEFAALHELTDKHGISLNALATQLRLPVSQVASWMIGMAPVPTDLVDRVARALGVHPSVVRSHSGPAASQRRPST